MQEEAVSALAAERADLLTLLANVQPGSWSSPTPCAPWTVTDVVAHLVENELTMGRLYRREGSQPPDEPPEVAIARWNVLPGVAVRAALWQHGIATQRALDAMTEDSWGAPVDARGCASVGDLVALHLLELAVHGHDLATALDMEPIWRPRLPLLAGIALRRLLTTNPTLLTPETEDGDPGGSIRIAIGAGASWTFRYPGGAGAATLDVEPEDLVLTLTGRRAVDDALASSRTTGDPDVIARLLSARIV